MAVASRKTNRARYMLVLLVLAAITLVTVDERSNGGGMLSSLRARAQEVFAPIQHATHSILRPVGDFLTGAIHSGELRSENAYLRARLNADSVQIQAANGAQAQVEQLLENEKLTYAAAIPRVFAQVVDQSSSNFEQTIELNRGSASGVLDGMPVVSGPGLVGRVVSVSAKTCMVLLITDPTFAVGVRLDALGDPGVATGTGQGSPMLVNPLDSLIRLKVGTTLETSGLSGEIFPPNLPVGRVVSAVRSANSLQQHITIAPLVDLYRLQYVSVLQWSPPA